MGPLNESNRPKWTPTITLALPEVLAHFLPGQQCLGQGLCSRLLRSLHLTLHRVTFLPGPRFPLFPSGGAQERLMDGACL